MCILIKTINIGELSFIRLKCLYIILIALRKCKFRYNVKKDRLVVNHKINFVDSHSRYKLGQDDSRP